MGKGRTLAGMVAEMWLQGSYKATGGKGWGQRAGDKGQGVGDEG